MAANIAFPLVQFFSYSPFNPLTLYTRVFLDKRKNQQTVMQGGGDRGVSRAAFLRFLLHKL